MPYLVEQLSARHIDVEFDDSTQLLRYQLTATIDKGLLLPIQLLCRRPREGTL